MNKDDIISFLRKHKPMLIEKYHVKNIGLFGSKAQQEACQKIIEI